MKSRRTYTSPLLRWALRRARAGETDTKTVLIIVFSVIGGLALLVCGGLALLIIPAVQQARNAARQAANRTMSRNNLQMIGLAMHNYHDTYLRFPPGGIYGEDGTAYHAWQTSLLPYIDQAPLYNAININVPWTDPANTGYFAVSIPTYLDPSVTEVTDPSTGLALSHYAGNKHLLVPNGNKGIRDITDGTANTVLVGEVAAGFKPWGDPSNVRDPADGLRHDATTFGTVNRQRGTVEFLFVDGSVHEISETVSPEVLKAVATPDGGESIPAGSF